MKSLPFVLLLAAGSAAADDGRLLATGGATQLEGAAGGGMVPWAVLSGYGTADGQGGTGFVTHVDTGDYRLEAAGVAWTFRNRIEVSYARQRFDLGTLQDALALPWSSLGQDIWGVKARIAGDVVYTAMPQIAVGIQYKRLRDASLPLAIGARDDSGTDAYVSATKLFLDVGGGHQVLVNGTLRWTSANQLGLLGHGGDRGDGRLVFEGSAAWIPDANWVVGVEYRQKPDQLGFATEDDWADAFVAWFPNKHVAVVAAWAELGSIASLDDQRGAYLSLQLSY